MFKVYSLLIDERTQKSYVPGMAVQIDYSGAHTAVGVIDVLNADHLIVNNGSRRSVIEIDRIESISKIN